MKRFLILMTFIACSAAGYAIDDISTIEDLEKKRDYILSCLTVQIQLCENYVRDITAANEMLITRLKMFDETLMHMKVPDVMTNVIRRVMTNGKVTYVRKMQKLSAFEKKLAKLRMILADANVCELINNYTTMHVADLQTELDNALEEAEAHYEKTVADIAEAEDEYRKKVNEIVIKRKHEQAEKEKALKLKIKNIRDEIRICRHGGRLGTCYSCDRKKLEIKQIESEITNLGNIFANNIHNDAQLRALDEKTVKSDAQLAKSTYFAYRNSLCNDMYSKIVSGTRSQVMNKIQVNSMLAKQRIDELKQMKMLIEHPDFIRYSDVSSIIDAEVRAALDLQFTQRAAKKRRAQEQEDEKFRKQLMLIKAGNTVDVKKTVNKTVYINAN